MIKVFQNYKIKIKNYIYKSDEMNSSISIFVSDYIFWVSSNELTIIYLNSNNKRFRLMEAQNNCPLLHQKISN